MRLIDSHCHIDLAQFDEDRDDVLARAEQAGVKYLINPATNLENSRHILALVETYPNIFAAIGCHPYDAAEVNEGTLQALETMAAHSKVVAIGEIGLDYFRGLAPKSVQRNAFEAQLALAQKLALPVIVHQRESADDTMAILRQWATGDNQSGLVLHAFSGDVAMAKAATSLGFYVGIGGPVTFKNSRHLPDVIKSVPLNRLLIETDAPFLSPHPFRGKRNEPARVGLVAQKISDILQIDISEFSRQVTQNTIDLFFQKNVLSDLA